MSSQVNMTGEWGSRSGTSGRGRLRGLSTSTGPPPRLRYVATRANGQPAVGTYLLDGDGYRAIALDVLALRGDRIVAVTAFRTPAIFPRFGLPMEVNP